MWPGAKLNPWYLYQPGTWSIMKPLHDKFWWTQHATENVNWMIFEWYLIISQSHITDKFTDIATSLQTPWGFSMVLYQTWPVSETSWQHWPKVAIGVKPQHCWTPWPHNESSATWSSTVHFCRPVKLLGTFGWWKNGKSCSRFGSCRAGYEYIYIYWIYIYIHSMPTLYIFELVTYVNSCPFPFQSQSRDVKCYVWELLWQGVLQTFRLATLRSPKYCHSHPHST